MFQLFFTVVLAGACLSHVQAQIQLLEGKVVDPTRAAIGEARVNAVREGRQAGISTVSNRNGEFSISVEPGAYRVTIAADGFQQTSYTLHVPRNDNDPREFLLQVAPSREIVTVTETAGYQVAAISSGTKTLTPLRNVPQSITVVSQELIKDQLMMSMADAVRYVPGITAIQGENNRDQLVIRGNSTSADFFLNGVRDDVQYFRDFYNLDRLEALKGPNAMIFGRGGGGGVINRVTKEAGFTPVRELSLQGGSFSNKRAAMDFDQPLNQTVAFRMNGMYENSGSFRNYVNLERYGINPTLTIVPGQATKITLGYEYLRDHRVADRGIPSFQGRPADTPISTFFGNPDGSRVRARVNLGTMTAEHQLGRWNIQNRTLVGDYERFYQNFVPGAVTADKIQVALSAYNNAAQRRNIFNQTDVTYLASTGGIRHTLLAGVEAGRQLTNNFRNTGYFHDAVASISVPYENPTVHTPVSFRQSPTDASNFVTAHIGVAYIQDQIEISRFIQVIAGLRLDHFDLRYQNRRNGDKLRRIDNLVSPRAGIVFKPASLVSIYASYSVSYLPSSGDQFSSLTAITQQVKPEKFGNYEVGIKWDMVRYLSLTTAVYRLDRTNTRSIDPNDPTRIVQTGSQRTNGYEAGLSGSITRAWKIAGGYAYQDAFVSSATAAARAGAQVAQAPHHTFSLWNNYRIHPRLGAGLGILNRSDMYAAIDNTVTLPGYARVDAAVFYSLTERVRMQANVENLSNRRYYINADSNNNISPGSSRALRIGLTARF